MNINDVKNIAVIGAGNMGHQIALLCAIHGYKTTCTDVKEDILKKAEQFANTYLPARVEKGKMTREQAEPARANISFSSGLEATVKDADYVIEAVLEILDVKRKLFADLDRMAPPHAILATNSSYIVSSRVADVTRRPDKVLNMEKFRETGDPADLPPPSLVERYMKGCYGEKTGKGWYDYSAKRKKEA